MAKHVPEMITYPSLLLASEAFAETLYDVPFEHVDSMEKRGIDELEDLLNPILIFRGTAKLHGLHSAVVQTYSGSGTSMHFQCRDRILNGRSRSDSLQGFREFANSKKWAFKGLMKMVELMLGNDGKRLESIAIFGEWCGGDIQDNVALAHLDKMFVIFNVKVSHTVQDMKETIETWLHPEHIEQLELEEENIYNTQQFRTVDIQVNFRDKVLREEGRSIMEGLALQVRECCPVGLKFGVRGRGEGLVWQALPSQRDNLQVVFPEEALRHTLPKFWFKTTEPEHSPNSPAVPRPAGVDMSSLALTLPTPSTALNFANETIFDDNMSGGTKSPELDLEESMSSSFESDILLLDYCSTTRATSKTMSNSGDDIPIDVQPLHFKCEEPWFCQHDLDHEVDHETEDYTGSFMKELGIDTENELFENLDDDTNPAWLFHGQQGSKDN